MSTSPRKECGAVKFSLYIRNPSFEVLRNDKFPSSAFSIIQHDMEFCAVVCSVTGCRARAQRSASEWPRSLFAVKTADMKSQDVMMFFQLEFDPRL